MMAPRRIRLSRARGWRKPSGAVSVARPTRWGNPHNVVAHWHPGQNSLVDAATAAVAAYRSDLLAGRLDVTVEDVRRELAGRDLCCWCRLDDPCHADVLLEVANA